MADKYYEPFLINPPKTLLGRYRRNDYQPGMDEAAPWEMGTGIRPGHTGIKKRGRTRSTRRRKLGAKKAARTRALHAKEKAMAKMRRKKVRRHHKATAAQLRALRKARRALSAKRRGVTKRHRRRTVATKHRRRTTRRHVARKRVSLRSRRRVASVKRGWAKRHKRHIVAAYRIGGHMRTSPFARSVRRNLRLNPFRRLRRNPFGEELMVVGANPRRRRRRHYSVNPRRRYNMATRRHRRHRRSTRRMRHNPMATMKTLLPMVAAGTVGAIATKMAPRLIGVASTWTSYGVQAVTVLGGGFLLDKYMGRSISEGWIIGGAASVLSSVVSGMLGQTLAGLGLIGGDLEYAAFPEQMGAFPAYNGLGDFGMSDEFAPTTVI